MLIVKVNANLEEEKENTKFSARLNETNFRIIDKKKDDLAEKIRFLYISDQRLLHISL